MEVEEAGPGRGGKSMKSVKGVQSFSQSTNSFCTYIRQCVERGRCRGE